MSQLAICLQYYENDRRRALELARLIAANEPKFRDDVIFCLVNRFDAEAAPSDLIDLLGTKFTTVLHTSNGRATGWPSGCNEMAKSTFRFANQEWRFGPWHDVDGVLLMEPDCIPIARDWIDQLKEEWATARAAGKLLMGTWRDGGGLLGHINGNMIVRPDFAEKVQMNEVFEWLAWDCAIVPQVHDQWQVTNLICNRWKEAGLSNEEIMTHRNGVGRPVLVHGVKDDSVWDYARKKLLP